MRKLLIGSIALSSVLVAGYFFVLPFASAQKVARSQWEYASIRAVFSIYVPPQERMSRVNAVAEICYVQSTGCKSAEIKHELNYGAFLQERGLPENTLSREMATSTASEIAYQKALAQLGNDGWELVSEPKLGFEFRSLEDYNKYENKTYLTTRTSTVAIYFKRLKAQ